MHRFNTFFFEFSQDVQCKFGSFIRSLLTAAAFFHCPTSFCMKRLHTRLSGTKRWQWKKVQNNCGFCVDQHLLLEANDWKKFNDWFNEKVCKTHVNIIIVKRIGIFSNSIRLLLKIIGSFSCASVCLCAPKSNFKIAVYSAVNCVKYYNDNEIEQWILFNGVKIVWCAWL